MGAVNYFYRLKNKIFFMYYFVYVLFFIISIYLAKTILTWRNEFISENCDITFKGYIFRDVSLLFSIISVMLFIFLISNVLIFVIIDQKYKKSQYYYVLFQVGLLLILLVLNLLFK